MLNLREVSAIGVVRDFLAEAAFPYMSYRLIPGHDSVIFPDFALLHDSLKPLSGIYRLLFTVFRQGHAAEEGILRRALPSRVFDALVATGLLVPGRAAEWRTPSLALVPIEGLVLAVSLPPHYPTATTRKQPVYVGIESIWLTRALPGRMDRLFVLDICAGSGIQGLLCAARGAARVVGLELDETAVEVARFNAALNGLADRVEIRRSDLFSALHPEERFDFFVCNPPFMPVMEDVDYPLCGAGGADGQRVTRRLIEALPSYLAPRAEGVLFCNALGDRFSIQFNREVLMPLAEREGWSIRAHVDDKHPMSDYVEQTLTGNLINTCPELSGEERRRRIEVWLADLQRREVPAEMVYGQLVRFRTGETLPAFSALPAYQPLRTDPLVARAQRALACP